MADDDLTFSSTDLRPTNGKIKLDIVAGFWEPAEVRGEDDIVPGAEGRVARPRQADRRLIRLHGYVQGIGSTLTAQQQDFNSTMASLGTLFDRTADPADLVVSSPYMGLSSGSKTIKARCTSMVLGKVVALRFVELDIELESVDSPPDWT